MYQRDEPYDGRCAFRCARIHRAATIFEVPAMQDLASKTVGDILEPAISKDDGMVELCRQIDGFYNFKLSVFEFYQIPLSVSEDPRGSAAFEGVVLEFCQKHISTIWGNAEFARLFSKHKQLAFKILRYKAEEPAE